MSIFVWLPERRLHGVVRPGSTRADKPAASNGTNDVTAKLVNYLFPEKFGEHDAHAELTVTETGKLAPRVWHFAPKKRTTAQSIRDKFGAPSEIRTRHNQTFIGGAPPTQVGFDGDLWLYGPVTLGVESDGIVKYVWMSPTATKELEKAGKL